MFKRLISLRTASASFIALLLLANAYLMMPVTTDINRQTAIKPIVKPVSLNVANLELGFSKNQKNLLSDHSGCSCSLCNKLSNNLSFGV